MSLGERPSRVLQIVRPATGGIRQHVLSLASHLDPARSTTALAAPADFLHNLPHEAPFLTTYAVAIAPRLSLWADLMAARRLASLVPVNADLVHAHGLRAAWIAALAQRFRPFPLIISAHNLVETGRLTRSGLRFATSRASRMIAVSDAVASSLKANGVSERKIVVIPNGIDLTALADLPDRAAARRELDIANDAYLVACIARLSSEKGIDVLLKSAAMMPEAAFLVAGDGPERDTLVRTAPPNVRFLGRLDDVRPLLAASDVLAAPSRREGQGIVVLEAMAAGLAVVASCVGGLAETITDGHTGLLVVSDDPAALAAALRRLHDDPHLRQTLAETGLARVQERYDVHRMAEAIQQIYDFVLLGRPS